MMMMERVFLWMMGFRAMNTVLEMCATTNREMIGCPTLERSRVTY
jgi:hypothetical protein